MKLFGLVFMTILLSSMTFALATSPNNMVSKYTIEKKQITNEKLSSETPYKAVPKYIPTAKRMKYNTLEQLKQDIKMISHLNLPDSYQCERVKLFAGYSEDGGLAPEKFVRLCFEKDTTPQISYHFLPHEREQRLVNLGIPYW